MEQDHPWLRTLLVCRSSHLSLLTSKSFSSVEHMNVISHLYRKQPTNLHTFFFFGYSSFFFTFIHHLCPSSSHPLFRVNYFTLFSLSFWLVAPWCLWKYFQAFPRLSLSPSWWVLPPSSGPRCHCLLIPCPPPSLPFSPSPFSHKVCSFYLWNSSRIHLLVFESQV